MRVVGLQELCSMPEGTIFSGFEPDISQCLYRLGTTIEAQPDDHEYYGGKYADFFYHTLTPEVDQNAPRGPNPHDVTFYDIERGTRWGNFDPDELFVLYEPDDVAKLLKLIRDMRV